MKKNLIGLLAASLVTMPALAVAGGSSGGGSGGGSGTALTSTTTATANGGAGGAGGSATGGAATGGSATGGAALSTGGAATGGSANGNASNINVSLTNTSGSGASGTDANGVYNSKATVDYGGTYTVKSAPTIAAPALTSTFSDTCMGSSSFGLSLVGFGATGGTTTVDEACVRRLDSREFRAMGMIDVALALLCQSPANRQAVEATGRACPSATSNSPTAANNRPGESNDPIVRRRMGLDQNQNTNQAAANAAVAVPVAAAAAAAVTAAAPAAEAMPQATPQAGAVDMETAMSAPAVTAESGGGDAAQGGGVSTAAVTQSQPEVAPLQDAATAIVTGDQ